MKSYLLTFIGIILFSISGISQETKVYIKSNSELGKFYVYVDSILINRAPQIQVGILGLEKKSKYSIRVVFQNHDQMPISGTIKPKKERTRLYLLYGGTKSEVKSRRKSGLKEAPIPGDTPASHPSMPNYKGRLGCDYPIGDEVLNQVISQMTSILPKTPMEIATEAITSYCFTTHQFKEILLVLEDDVERVKLSKIAWFYIYDQENFSNLKNAFTEPSQINQIIEFTKRNQ